MRISTKRKTQLKKTLKVAQLVKCLTLDLGSGHLMVCEFKPHIRQYADSMEFLSPSLSLSVSLSLSLSAHPLLCLSLKINK